MTPWAFRLRSAGSRALAFSSIGPWERSSHISPRNYDNQSLSLLSPHDWTIVTHCISTAKLPASISYRRFRMRLVFLSSTSPDASRLETGSALSTGLQSERGSPSRLSAWSSWPWIRRDPAKGILSLAGACLAGLSDIPAIRRWKFLDSRRPDREAVHFSGCDLAMENLACSHCWNRFTDRF